MKTVVRLLLGACVVVAVALWAVPGLLTWFSSPTGGPAATPASAGGARRYYVVQASVDGRPEYLYDIAVRTLGDGNRYREIFELNQGRIQPDGGRLTDVTDLRPGWILALPDDAAGPAVQVGEPPMGTGIGDSGGGPARGLLLSAATVVAMVVGFSVALVATRARAARRSSAGRGVPAPATSSTGSVAPRQFPPPVDPFSGPIVGRDGQTALASLTGLVTPTELPPRTRLMPQVGLTPSAEPPAPIALTAQTDPTEVSGPAETPAQADITPQTEITAPIEPATQTGLGTQTRLGAHAELSPHAGVTPAAALAPQPDPAPSSTLAPGPGPAGPTVAGIEAFEGEVTAGGHRWRVRLTGARVAVDSAPWRWLDPNDDPVGVMPVVLGNDGPRRLCVDLAQAPATFTITGPIEVCREQVQRLMAQVRAAGRTVVVVGDVLGPGATPGDQTVARFPDDGTDLPPGIVVTAGLAPDTLPAARALVSRTHGQTLTVVIGPVLRGSWSMSIDLSTVDSGHPKPQ